jgi:S-adenosylhomocysteine hydrolase
VVSRHPTTERPTALGPSLHRRGGGWTIDLTDLPLFHGLSVLSRALGEQLVERCQAECFDIDLERRLKASENPELVALGCTGVTVHAERDVVAHVPADVEAFQHHLRAVFGTLQQARWRRHILPDDAAESPRALVFTFVAATGFEYRFVLDRVPAPKTPHRFYLRIAIESPRGRRLDLAGIPHVVVDDLDAREYIAGSTRIAQTLRDMVQREAERGRRVHLERRKRGSFVFGQLERGGLGDLDVLHLAWNDRFAGALAASDPAWLDHLLKRVLLLLEDRTVRACLAATETIALVNGEVEVFLDLSQRGRVLNLAFDQPRGRATVASYLERMPALAAVARAGAGARPLAGLSCIVVHHITAEVLGLLAALRALGAGDLDVLFIRYAGEVPNDYLDALLDLDRTARSYTLQHLQEPGVLEGRFVLGQQLSPLDGLERVATRLRREPVRYLEAMVAVAVALFVRALERGRRIVVVEDGGYLVPELTRAAAAGATVGSFAAEWGVGSVATSLGRRALRDVLAERLVGSVEHTRSGFDRLAAVERQVGLVRPAYSIAISRLKVEEESREVAAGILAAVEAVLHARGAVLSRRRPLVLGSRGAIGRRLVAALDTTRVERDAVVGIDLAAAARGGTEARRWSALPAARRRAVDLVIGVTGVSVLGAAELEELVRHGTAETIYFASGSTKTVEFRDVAAAVDAWASRARPHLGGMPIAVTSAEVADPQSGRRYGTAVTIRLGRGDRARTKTLVFIADQTPVNFLFYGVPTEGIDRVMAELLATTLRLVRDVGSRRPPATRLYAVDRDLPSAGSGS